MTATPMRIDSEGDLLEDHANALGAGAHLAVMPIARLTLEWSPLTFPQGITFYPSGIAQTDSLGIIPNDPDSGSLAEVASATSGLDVGTLSEHPLVVFPFSFDWESFRKNSHKGNLAFIRRLSDHVDRGCLDLIRYIQCPFFANGDPLQNLPGRAGQLNSNPMMSGVLLYNHSLRQARIIGGDAFTHTITRGLGLFIDDVDESRFPNEGEVGFITRHGLSLYTAVQEANNSTACFIQYLALLEFLAFPDEYRKFEEVKKVIARYVARDASQYKALLDRFFELTGKKEEGTGRIIGYRTRLIHMGERIEDVVPDDDSRKALFYELDGYIRAVIDHMIENSGASYTEYLKIRGNLRPY